MSLKSDKRQMSGQLELVSESRGEASTSPGSDESLTATHGSERS